MTEYRVHLAGDSTTVVIVAHTAFDAAEEYAARVNLADGETVIVYGILGTSVMKMKSQKKWIATCVGYGNSYDKS